MVVDAGKTTALAGKASYCSWPVSRSDPSKTIGIGPWSSGRCLVGQVQLRIAPSSSAPAAAKNLVLFQTCLAIAVFEGSRITRSRQPRSGAVA